jgi:nucleotide-binding universal stress UspA family protein
MTDIETLHSAPSPSATKPLTAPATLVVATDGSDASSAAFAAADLIAENTGADIRVVSVLEPLPMPSAVPYAVLEFEGIGSERLKELARRVQVQMNEHGPQSSTWPLETRIGVPAAEIAESAHEHGAELVIVGAGRHGMLERLIGEDTAARIAQLGSTPLLVASPGMRRLPHRVAIAIDLDPSQLGDLPAVLSMFGPAPSVTCVHVQRHEEFPGSDAPPFARAYENAVTESFAVVQAAIAKAPSMRADLIRLRGDPATELLQYAEKAKVELLVLGLRRHYGLRRLLGGGVALKVLRGATCSVLIVPESVGRPARNIADRSGAAGVTHTAYDAAMWPSQLKQFTQRNAGRRATLEVDGAAIGALIQVVELPFIGADYDHRDGRVDILLGDFAGSDRHFSRSIPAPEAISVLSAADERDSVLCVTYPGGQTLLTFKS